MVQPVARPQSRCVECRLRSIYAILITGFVMSICDAARQNQALVADYNSAPAAIFGCNVQIAEIIFMTASDSQIIHLYISSLRST